jgi:tRNA (guanine-N7-)-methyltransferase
MPRVKGPLLRPFEGEAGWPILNPHIFGSNERGGHHIVARPEALPMPWATLLGRDAPRTLEVGTNRGFFLRALARLQPERDHIGIEIRRRYAWRVAYELGRDDAPRNCRIIWGDAKLLSGGLFDDATVADIYINFPDPWWKAKHAKRRLVDDGFAAMLARLLAPGASIWVKTDVPAIAQEITEALVSVPGLIGPTHFGQDDLPLSYRERSCLALGLPIDRFRFTRPAG